MIYPNINIEKVGEQLRRYVNNRYKLLTGITSGIFDIQVDNVVYEVFYENNGNAINFSVTPPNSLPELNKPVLRLAIGQFLLPHAMTHTPGFKSEYTYSECIEHNEDLPPDILHKIMDEIAKQGFINLIR